jgi:DNA-binding MarR family transcriptional regulator
MTYEFTSSLPYLLNRVGVRMGELFSIELAKHGLTLPMYRVLAVLKQQGPLNLGDLSRYVTVELSTLSRLVTSMQKKGLVSRVRPEDNGRTVRITITPQGERKANILMPQAAHFENVGIGDMAPNEISALKKALVDIFENLNKMDAKNTGA